MPKHFPLADPIDWGLVPLADEPTCVLTGDINLQDRQEPARAFRHVVSTLRQADVLFANLEGCLYRPGGEDIPDKVSWRHSDESMVAGLLAIGVNGVGCANNVTFGEEAILHSLSVLKRSGIPQCGAGNNIMTANEPLVLERSGFQIGFLQRTARLHGLDQPATEGRAGVAYFNPEENSELEKIYDAVSALKTQVDVVVFSHHLRNTGTKVTEPYQRALARGCIEAGADLVYGHGAHVNQGIEVYEGTPIFHCVGQLAFDWVRTRHHRDGLVLRFLVADGELTGLRFVPVYRDDENNVYFADPTVGEGARQLAALREDSPGISLEIEGDVVRIAELEV